MSAVTVDGVIVVDKPAGMTSHDVVDEIRRRFGTRRVGHGGTLDPDATGVLVVGLGRATRFLSYAQAAPKGYVADAAFGIATTTQDASGDVVEGASARDLTAGAVAAAARAFVGEIEQVPPMVSAVKVGGRRLHEIARRGEEVERAPRAVTVYALEVGAFTPGDVASAALAVTCSGGTYVRTLVHDLGLALGCGAHLARLRRVRAGGFTDADAVGLEAVSTEHLRPIADAVGHLARVEVGPEAERLVATGRPLPVPEPRPPGDLVAVVRAGALLAVYRRAGDRLVADRVVSS